MNNSQNPSIEDIFNVIDKAKEKLGKDAKSKEQMELFLDILEIGRGKKPYNKITFNENGELMIETEYDLGKTKNNLFEVLTKKNEGLKSALYIKEVS